MIIIKTDNINEQINQIYIYYNYPINIITTDKNSYIEGIDYRLDNSGNYDMIIGQEYNFDEEGNEVKNPNAGMNLYLNKNKVYDLCYTTDNNCFISNVNLRLLISTSSGNTKVVKSIIDFYELNGTGNVILDTILVDNMRIDKNIKIKVNNSTIKKHEFF